jgi:uncharacterized protein (TIGR00288 family)
MMAAVEKSQVAAFIDFENVVIAAEKEHGEFRLTAILEAISQQGRLVVKRAYGDWSRFYKYQSDLTQNAVDLIQLYSMRAGSGKNAADIQIAIDAMEVIFTHPKVEVFAIVSGDSDFTALVRKLKNYGKYVVGIGLRSSTSELLVRACDEFVLYENLVGKSSRTAAFDKERARDVLARALRQLLGEGQTDVPTMRVKQTILSLDPTFDEVNLGYKQFEDFLVDQGDLLDLNECGLRPAIVKLRNEQINPEALYPTNGRILTNTYRDGLMSAGLALVDPETRQAVLRDLYQLLEKNPARLTLNEAEQSLKQQYDAENILRSREVVREVVKLAARSAALQFALGAPTLNAAVSLLPGITQQRFIDRSEATYIKSLMDQNLIDTENPDDKAIAWVLYGTMDEALRVQALRKELDMVRGEFQELVTGPLMESPLVELLSRDTLRLVLRDMTEFKLDEPANLYKTTELVNQGMSVRLRDFSSGAELFLKASVMQKLLVEQGEPGASVDDARWYLASYCSARAGQYFFSHDYAAARQYYLGFFAISQDTEPFYAKVKNLTRPMLSYYFTIAANEHGVLLDRSPSQIAPARMAVILCTHEDVRVARAWRELARDLSQVNKGIINLLIEELDAVERDPAQIDQARVYLLSLLV